VRATDYGGATESEALWAFTVRPPVYQSAWFYVLAVLTLAMMVWLAWWVRLRSVRNQFGLVVAERARVSREIHDTLLQSLGAIGLELEAIAGQLDGADDTTGQALRRLRRSVVHCVREARQSIWELRSPSLGVQDLVLALRELADRLASGGAVHVDVVVTGRPRQGSAESDRQLLRIAQEAVTNAIHHGSPTHIRIEVAYGEESLVLRISDDGCGFVRLSGDDAAAGEHQGLLNMQERAEEVGGRLMLDSRPGHGTVVEVEMPLSPTP
jgi:signal transduction histidine kinase